MNPAVGAAALFETPDAGQLTALREEARAYEHGEGVGKDPLRAVRLYCEAARYGDREAQFSLGWMHANGRGVERSDALAAFFFKLAADAGHEQAWKMLRFFRGPAAAQPDCMKTPEMEFDVADLQLAEQSPQRRQILALVSRLAPEYGLSPRLVMAIIRAESNFQPDAVSPKNAQGLMQLIPETSVRFNVRKPFDPEQNIRGGMAYLRWLLAYFEGRVPLVAAAYNAGEGTVNRYRGIPPYAETRGYVRRIMQHFAKERHPYDPLVTEPSPELPRIRMTVGSLAAGVGG